ncbi:MAG: haloacid dehalogenase [Actinomycetota bacterium]
MSLDDLTLEFQRRFDDKTAAREQALIASRSAIRSSANAIRAVHRGEAEKASELMGEARAALDRGLAAVERHQDVRYAGYLQDAQKEYAEARITAALVAGDEIPDPDDVGVEPAPYLNGMAEAIGEIRRHILDLLRAGETERGEELLTAMEDMYAVLVAIDYPDAITMHLRRSTDIARGIMEKTRGDLSLSLVQKDLRDALERHAGRVLGSDDS